MEKVSGFIRDNPEKFSKAEITAGLAVVGASIALVAALPLAATSVLALAGGYFMFNGISRLASQ